MKTLLITGAEGFTGKHFIDYIRGLNLRLNVVCADIISRNNEINDGMKFVKCDLLNIKDITGVVRRSSPDYIFHFAGLTSGKDYKKLLSANLITTTNLLDAVVENRRKCDPKILIIGSSAEYGSLPDKSPIPEYAPLRPITPYGVSKVTQELAALQYHIQYGLYVVVVRPFNFIGPRQPSKLVCGALIEQIRSIGDRESGSITVGNLSMERDFVDIRDAVRAYWMLLTYKKNIAGEVFNLGSGRSCSIRSIVNMLCKLCGKDIEVVQVRNKVRTNDIISQRADLEKIKKTIGWQPVIPIKASLKDMLYGE